MSAGSPLEVLEQELKARVSLLRRDIEGTVSSIAERLEAYRFALEQEAVQKFTTSHSLKGPRGQVLSSRDAARALFEAVRSLPELASANPNSASESSATEVKAEPLTRGAASAAAVAGTDGVPGERTLRDVLPRLVESVVAGGKIVVVGAFAGRTKTLPEPLEASAEWIDTARDGVHAVGNLPQRMKRGGIAGVILCEQVISHQHSEPVLQAARASHVPVGFAGKGGNLGLTKALQALEAQLREA